jgi:L-threonylcarbamoyladenylate synthase
LSAPFDEAARIVRQGGLIAYPTETVYGLGCLPTDTAALEKLLALKQRNPDKGLILLGANASQLKPFTRNLTASDWEKISRARQRATTWIVPAAPGLSPLLTGAHNHIALRLSHYDFVRQLCNACQSALVSTSANLSGEPAATRWEDLPRRLLDQLDYVLPGSCAGEARPSRIIDLKTGRILRD